MNKIGVNQLAFDYINTGEIGIKKITFFLQSNLIIKESFTEILCRQQGDALYRQLIILMPGKRNQCSLELDFTSSISSAGCFRGSMNQVSGGLRWQLREYVDKYIDARKLSGDTKEICHLSARVEGFNNQISTIREPIECMTIDRLKWKYERALNNREKACAAQYSGE